MSGRFSFAKVRVIAASELAAMARSKAFIISIVLLPAMVLIMSGLQRTLSRHIDRAPQRVAVAAPPEIYTAIAAQADAPPEAGAEAHAAYVIEPAGAALDDAARLALSERVRRGALFAFAEVPPAAARADALAATTPALRLYSERPGSEALREWLGGVVDRELHRRQLRAAHVDDATVDALDRHATTEHLGLLARGRDGQVRPAAPRDVVRSLVVPIILPFLLYLFVIITAPQVMHAVLTEKMTRVAEVLLGSVSPFELMAGKLIGAVVVGLVLGGAYVAGGAVVMLRSGLTTSISPPLLVAFLIMLPLALLLYGAICLAVGAACTEVKDAQSLLLPVIFPLMLPILLGVPLINAPSSPLAVALSLFPPTAPVVMLLRLGLEPSIPWWQLGTALALGLGFVAVVLWAAGRVFRIGLLMQGKSPRPSELLRWIVNG